MNAVVPELDELEPDELVPDELGLVVLELEVEGAVLTLEAEDVVLALDVEVVVADAAVLDVAVLASAEPPPQPDNSNPAAARPNTILTNRIDTPLK